MSGSKRPAGFTLVELILVMALLATVMAFVAPVLSRSLRGRELEQEAARFVALTEYARDEAVSRGVPMVVWLQPAAGRLGLAPKSGWTGNESRDREFEVNPNVHFEVASARAGGDVLEVAEFAPDGAPATSNAALLRVIDRFDDVLTVAQTSDGWGYEISQEQP